MSVKPDGKWTAGQIHDQSGKVVIVTGANSGIGYVATKELGANGAQVVMACRSLDKGQDAMGRLLTEHTNADLELMELDLANLDSVRRFANEYKTNHDRLDILVNNAGVMALPKRYETEQGFEMQIGTNHLGHFALTGLLLDLILKTPGARVVTITSYAHFFGRINFDDLNSENSYQKWLAYGQSKLANVMFSYELQRRFSQAEIDAISISAHPGYAATHLQDTTWLFSLMNPIFAQSPEMGALPTLFAATNPEVEGGEYIGPDGLLAQRGYPTELHSSRQSYNEDVARRLWQVSEELTGVNYRFGQ